MIVFIINGAPRSGKDTFIDYLRDVTGETVLAFSSIDWVKEMAFKLGWDGVKDTKGRAFCSEIKDACTKYNDKPFKTILEGMAKTHTRNYPYFATNIREPSEISKLENYCIRNGIPCYSIWIRNFKAEEKAKSLDNTGDTQYMNHTYSYQVRNHYTLGDYKNNVETLIGVIKEKHVHNDSRSNQIEEE